MTVEGRRDGFNRARELLQEAQRVLVLTGAGISAESGIPTFRGEKGLWKEHRPEELATPQAFQRDPRLVWEWYDWRRQLIAECRPNPGHTSLARWLSSRGSAAVLATQNVDGLHELAAQEAAPEQDPGILELHGSIFRVRCSGCGAEEAHRAAVDASSEATLPRCHLCGALLRPGVVWFGEMLPERVISAAFDFAQIADLALVVGTSSLVHPAASLPFIVSERGGRVVEVNPEPTPLTQAASVTIHGTAGTVLPEILTV